MVPAALRLAAWLALASLAGCAAAPLDGPGTAAYPAAMSEAGSAHWTVDRLEDGQRVVLQTDAGTTWDLPADWLPAGVREGDVLRVVATGAGGPDGPSARTVRLVRDDAERERRRNDARRLRDSLADGPEGDLDL